MIDVVCTHTRTHIHTQANAYTYPHMHTSTNVQYIHVLKRSVHRHTCAQTVYKHYQAQMPTVHTKNYLRSLMCAYTLTFTCTHKIHIFHTLAGARAHTHNRQQCCHYAIYTYVYTGAKDVNYAATAPGSAQLTRQYWIKLDNWLVEDMARPPDMRVKLRVAS